MGRGEHVSTLEDAVRVAAQAVYEIHLEHAPAERNGWDDLPAIDQHYWLEAVLPAVAAAAPVIAAQTRYEADGLARWLVALDDDDPTSPGRLERQTVTLQQITERARTFLA
jgi:hypothetical protein